MTHQAMTAAQIPDVSTRVMELLARFKGIDPATVTSETTFDSLEMDSLDKINLTFEVEEAFAIAIPDSGIHALRTVGDIIDGVQRLLAAKAGQEE